MLAMLQGMGRGAFLQMHIQCARNRTVVRSYSSYVAFTPESLLLIFQFLDIFLGKSCIPNYFVYVFIIL